MKNGIGVQRRNVFALEQFVGLAGPRAVMTSSAGWSPAPGPITAPQGVMPQQSPIVLPPLPTHGHDIGSNYSSAPTEGVSLHEGHFTGFKGGAGLGAIAASSITVQAAKNLDAWLAQNGCAGCDDFTSQLRQLSFTFKAACLTDPAVMNSVNLNMSTPLAMTAYGPGTDAAMALVLGAFRHYQGPPCTDDSGNCTAANVATPIIPPGYEPAAATFVMSINNLIQSLNGLTVAQQAAGQSAVFGQLTSALAAWINQIGFAIQQQQAAAAAAAAATAAASQPKAPNTPNPLTPSTAAAPMSTTKKVVIGSLIGLAVAGGGLLIYHAGKRS